MGINGERILVLAHELFAKCSELMRQCGTVTCPLFPCPHGSNAGKQVAFTHKGDDLTKI